MKTATSNAKSNNVKSNAKMSNKERLHRLYATQTAKGVEVDAIILMKSAKVKNVKEQTVTNWVNGWARGRRLPGYALRALAAAKSAKTTKGVSKKAAK